MDNNLIAIIKQEWTSPINKLRISSLSSLLFGGIFLELFSISFSEGVTFPSGLNESVLRSLLCTLGVGVFAVYLNLMSLSFKRHKELYCERIKHFPWHWLSAFPIATLLFVFVLVGIAVLDVVMRK